MFSGLRAALGIFDRISEQYEYWKEYQGEEIWIRRHTIERAPPDPDRPDPGSHEQTIYVIKGTVDDVMSFPPGFLLRDVEELVIQNDFTLLYTIGATEADEIIPGPEAHEVIREIEKKFVSFDSIDQLERGDWVESSREPFREVWPPQEDEE